MAVTHLVLCQAVPEGDWFCPDCRPKQRSRRLPSQQRKPVHEEDRDQDREEESAEDEEPEELLDEEVAVRYDSKHF